MPLMMILMPCCAQVGSQFVQQYYTVLHSTPRYLHRFYTDVSMMSHNDAEGGQSFTVSSQKASRSPIIYHPASLPL